MKPAESLLIIESMIDRARNRFSENGHLYLLWGWVVFGCAVFQFLAMRYQWMKNPHLVWMLTWAAFIYQFIYLRRHNRNRPVKTYSDEILSAVWLVFVACGFITGIVVGSKGYWSVLYVLFLMLYGMPTVLSGVILRFRPLIYGGLACWALSIVALFVQPVYMLLILALAVMLGWIIPGYLMRSRYLRENPS